jgi:eukaryotic-like serine/threonine-protein kinase
MRLGRAGHNRPMGRMGRTGQRDPVLVGERYRLVEQLGTGGMSVVWRGYDEILGRQVAVKVLSAKLAGDEQFRERLKQEALAAARLCHPHITGIFDFGQTCPGDGPAVPYVVMELIDGEPVSARLRRRGAMTWREAATMTAEVASALAVAHARGVVHRDITPANVMLTPAGAKVVDFGISALVGQSDAGPDGSLLGTPAYLAPERLAGGAVRPATDVYALGVLLYRCLTARLPWPAENTNEALRAHLYAAPEPLPALPGLPAAVADLCFRCLAKDPEVRPAAAELAHALADLTGSAVPLVPWSAARPVGPDVSRPPPAVGRRRAPRRSLLTYLGPPGARRSGHVRRLRATLRLGSRLHPSVEALGGGVFVGGRLARDLVTGRAIFAGRHRIQATAGTLAVIAAAVVIWAGVRGPAEATSAQAAAVSGPVAAVLSPAGCRVTYQVWRDSGRDFEAGLTLHNDGRRALRGWRLEFAYPGNQHLTTKPRRVRQDGPQVTVRGDADGGLAAGHSLTVKLHGAYRDANPLPQAFALNGHVCDATLLGATGGSGDDPADVEAAGAADPEK